MTFCCVVAAARTTVRLERGTERLCILASDWKAAGQVGLLRTFKLCLHACRVVVCEAQGVEPSNEAIMLNFLTIKL